MKSGIASYSFKAILIGFPLLISQFVLSQNDTISKSDSVLLKQIENQMNSQDQSQKAAPARVAPSTLPDISVIGDFQTSYKNNTKHNFDAGINEAELSLQSVVD